MLCFFGFGSSKASVLGASKGRRKSILRLENAMICGLDRGPTVVAKPRTVPPARTEIINQVINRYKSPPTRTRVLFLSGTSRAFMPVVFGSRLSSKSRDTAAIRHAGGPGRDDWMSPNKVCRWSLVTQRNTGRTAALVIFYAVCTQRYHFALFLISRYLYPETFRFYTSLRSRTRHFFFFVVLR